MKQEAKIERRSEMFWKVAWPLIVVIILGGAMLFSPGCGGGGGGSDGSKAENSDQNQNSNNPPADDNKTTPPPNNNTTPPADNNNTDPPSDNTQTSDSYEYKFVATADMDTARCLHTATLLNTGDVLVVGGWNINGFQSGVELYHPDTGIFEMINNLPFNISSHTASLLSDGRVFIYGMGAAIYDPATKKITSVTKEGSTERINHTATTLLNGKILIAGGDDRSWLPVVLQKAVLYDPGTGAYSSTGSMVKPRSNHTATLLVDGRVLITGGVGGNYNNDAEIFNPATGKFTIVDTMHQYRAYHAATLLPNGKVLIVGGTSYYDMEIFDPATNKFYPGGYLKTARSYNHTVTLLPNGKVLIAGGISSGGVTTSVEIYDPETRGSSSKGNMLYSRYYHVASLLQNGKVLMTGGAAAVNSNYLKSAELMK